MFTFHYLPARPTCCKAGKPGRVQVHSPVMQKGPNSSEFRRNQVAPTEAEGPRARVAVERAS
eukprot:10614606-Alexandrium_andersonii.AAC.1